MIVTKEIDSIVAQIVKKFAPLDIYLFGSYAKGVIKKQSDIDLCIITKEDVDECLLITKNIINKIDELLEEG